MFDFTYYPMAAKLIFFGMHLRLSPTDADARIIVNQDDIDRLATKWEIDHNEYDHAKLVNEFKRTMREAVKIGVAVFIGRGYYDVTGIVKAATADVYATNALHIADEMVAGKTEVWRAESLRWYCHQLSLLTGDPHDPNDYFPVSEPLRAE